MFKKFIKFKDYIELHDRGDDRKAASGGMAVYVNNSELRTVDGAGAIQKTLAIDKGDTTESVSPGFGSWVTADADRPSWVEIDASAVTDGTSDGEVSIDVDEDGDDTAEYSFTVAHIAADNATGTTQKDYAKVYIPAGGQYRVTNTSDPNSSNAINTVREVTA